MRRILFLLTICAVLTILLYGCDKEKALIFFSSKPITQNSFTVDKAEVNFYPGQRIYFVLLNPKPFTSNAVRLQILKIDHKPPFYAFSIAQTRDMEIDTAVQYATDYFCLHKDGYYILRIFSMDNLSKPLAEADFKVDPL